MLHLLLVIIYLSFISLGLPDGLLGAAWPSIYPELRVPMSYAGILSMIISLGTIVSSLMSDRLTRKLGAGKVTAVSVALTACALLGFSCSHSFWLLCLLAVPYGLGAGSVDAALNNYVALHYESKHMSWLHCMWGIGASTGPYIMGFILSGGGAWQSGYQIIGILQILLTAILVFSLPLWKRKTFDAVGADETPKALTFRQILSIPGTKAVMLCFFCYCAIEQTAGLWAASYLNQYRGLPADTAASLGSMFFLGITAGRAICGFLAMKLSDDRMIILGLSIMAVGIAALLVPGSSLLCVSGLILIGLGCAPIYPSLIHATPTRFGPDRSQAIIGLQMASAYVGTCLMPPLFGLIADTWTLALLPLYLILLLAVLIIMFRLLRRNTK